VNDVYVCSTLKPFLLTFSFPMLLLGDMVLTSIVFNNINNMIPDDRARPRGNNVCGIFVYDILASSL